MMIRKTLHRRDCIRQKKKKESGRGLANIENSVNASIRGPEYYSEKSQEKLITEAVTEPKT